MVENIDGMVESLEIKVIYLNELESHAKRICTSQVQLVHFSNRSVFVTFFLILQAEIFRNSPDTV